MNDTLRFGVSLTLSILSLLLFIVLMRWLGIKGLFGLVLGISITAYLILSKNPILLAIIRLTDSDFYIGELRNDKTDMEQQGKSEKAKDKRA